MSNNHTTPENSIFFNGINVIATYLKCQIRQQFTNEKKRKSLDELLEECEERTLQLEIAHERKVQQTENEVQGGNVDDTFASDINLPGCSTEELFNRVPVENSKWVVDGYMKEGLVNLLVAGGGVGKSILMVQIARAVAKGIRPEFLSSECCASVQLPVVFYRLEDFPGELKGKYGDGSALRNSGIRWFLPKDLLQYDLEDPNFGDRIHVISPNSGATTPNYYFGMTMDFRFMMPKDGMINGYPMIYHFDGDDDLFIFVDGVLLMDIGGIHNAWEGSINFATGKISVHNYSDRSITIKSAFERAGVFPDGSPWDESKVDKYFNGETFKDFSGHSMKMFYMERGAGASNIHMRFNLACSPRWIPVILMVNIPMCLSHPTPNTA